MSPNVSFTANQCRAARSLLGWSQERLARESRVSTRTIAGFEIGHALPPLDRTLFDIRRALEAGGVEFVNGKRPRARLGNHAKLLEELTAVAESEKSPLDLTLKIDELFSKHVERILQIERRLYLKQLTFRLERNAHTVPAQVRPALERLLELARRRRVS
jgi:transcriptional regulator with XRE-family HTH domain